MVDGTLIRLGRGGTAVEEARETLEAALALSLATARGFVWEGPRAPKRHDALFFESVCAGRFGEEASGVRVEPGAVREGSLRVEVEGGEPLLRLLRFLALPLGRSGKVLELTATGTTHFGEGETFEVLSSTWVHWMRQAGLDVAVRLVRAGFAPRGGGELTLAFGPPPSALAPLDLDRKGTLEALHIVSAAASLPSHVQQRQAARARSGVAIAGIDPNVQLLKLAASGSGSTVAITGVYDGTPVTVSAVSERGRSVEWVGEKAAAEFRRLVAGTGGIVPPALLPSLVLAAGLAPGPSRLATYRLPRTIDSHAALVRAFTGRAVRVAGKSGAPGEVVVEDEVASASNAAPY
jgi:RNA 3'-terminal phosphate cyclase (ATP)